MRRAALTGAVGRVFGLGIALVGAGCSTAPNAGGTAADEPAPVQTPAPTGRLLAPAGLARSGGGITQYRAMGEDAGTLRVEWLGVAQSGSSGVVAEFPVNERKEMAGEKGVERELTMRQDADGSIALVREVNHAERVIVDFTPALVVYPAQLGEGETFEQRLRMTVHPMSNPERVQAEGEVVQRVRWEGTERIPTPGGELEASKLVSTFEANLGGPQVLNETQEWLVAGVGVAALKKMEKTTLLGVRVRANSEWWVVENGK
jgi:hypothetical protein